MRHPAQIAIGAILLAAHAAAGTAAQPACCTIVTLEVDPSNPARDIATARDARSGETFRFAADGAAQAAIRLRQPVALDPSRQFALVAGQRLPLLGNAAVAAPIPPNTPACRRISVNGSNIVPGATLTLVVNGNRVRNYDGSAGGEVGDFLQPGLNRLGLSFAAPGAPGAFGTVADLRCLPPNVRASREAILRLQPVRGRLSAEVQVNYLPD